MIKRMWDFYLSPKMGWIIYGSFAWGLFPAGAAQGAASVFFVLCMNLAAIRSVLLLCLKDKRQEEHWQRGFWIGLLWWMLFGWSWSVAGNNAFTLWTFPVTAWTDLEGLMFVR
jgi:hypothetical protein